MNRTACWNRTICIAGVILLAMHGALFAEDAAIKPPPAPGKVAEHADYVNNLGKMLDAGLDPVKGSLDDAKTIFKAMRNRGDDPRLLHAWAVVCLKHDRMEEADRTLQLAARTDGVLFLPAWQLLIRVEMARDQCPRALRTIVQLAKATAESQKPWPDDAMKRDCASWCGRMMSLVQAASIASPSYSAAVVRCDREVLKTLREEHRGAYEEGKRNPLEPLATAAAISRDKEKNFRNLQGRDSNKDKKEESDPQAKNIKLRLEELDDELNELQTAYANLLTKSQLMTENIGQLEEQRSLVKTQLDNPQNVTPKAVLVQKNSQLSNEIVTQKKRLKAITMQIAETKNLAMTLLHQRNRLIGEYRKAFRESPAKSETVEQWEKRAAAKSRSEKNAADPADMQHTVDVSVPDAVELDYEREKTVILDSFPQKTP